MPLSLFLLTHVIRAGDVDAALVICFYTLFDSSISFFWHCSFATFLCYLLYCMPNFISSTLESYWIHSCVDIQESTSWLRGPLWPLLCSLEVLTTFSVPHAAQVTESTEANPYFFLLLCSTMTNWLKIKGQYWYSGKSDTLFWQCVFSFSLE